MNVVMGLAVSLWITADIMLSTAFFITCRLVRVFGPERESTPALRFFFRKSVRLASIYFFSFMVGVTVLMFSIWSWANISSPIILLPVVTFVGLAIFDLHNDLSIYLDEIWRKQQ